MYRKSRRTIALERKRKRCATMRASKERKRASLNTDGPDWVRVRTMLVAVYAHRDGRHVAVYVDGATLACGSERAVRAKLAGIMYRTSKEAGK